MLKKIIFISAIGICIPSCRSSNKEIRKIECIVISCRNTKKIISVHDEINRNIKRWEIRTACGNILFSPVPQNVGDTLEIIVNRDI